MIYLYDESGSPIGLQYRTKSYAANVFDSFYFEKNLQGDIIAVYNADGDRIGSYIYDAWGNFTVTVESTNTILESKIVRIFNPFRYRGYYYDTETQLYYLQSRYYNSQWGRFLNADVYVNANGDLVGFNMYAYCSNNPVMNVDPSGRAWYDWISTIVGFLNPISTTTAIGAIVAAAISGRWTDVKQDWANGRLNPFNQSEEDALEAQVLSFYKGSTVVKQDVFGTCSIFGTIWLEDKKSSTSLKHEYGHSIQENLLGPIYLSRIVLPSALYYHYDQRTDGSTFDYFSTPWERIADSLGGVSASERGGYKRGSLAWGIAENIFGHIVIPAYFVFGY